jgi:hypothetical protein
MALPRTHAQNRTEANSAAHPRRYQPRSLSIHSRWRFNRRRRAEYMSQIALSPPSLWQIAAIESLIRREWVTRLAEHGDDLDGTIRADREYQKLADAFRRSLAPPAASANRTERAAAFIDAVAQRSRGAAA